MESHALLRMNASQIPVMPVWNVGVIIFTAGKALELAILMELLVVLLMSVHQISVMPVVNVERIILYHV